MEEHIAATREEWERDYSGLTEDQLRHHLRNRDRSQWHSTCCWVRAAEAGDFRELRNRVDLARSGAVTLTNGDTEYPLSSGAAHDLPPAVGG